MRPNLHASKFDLGILLGILIPKQELYNGDVDTVGLLYYKLNVLPRPFVPHDIFRGL